MTKRNLGLMIVLSIVTFGIYGLWWYCSVQNQLREKIGRGFGGLGHLVVTIVTFGIYSIYWFFVVGGRLREAGAQKDNGILYGVLSLVGLSWVSALLIQNDINQM